MTEKSSKFLSFDKVIDEILVDFRIDIKQNDLFVLRYTAFLLEGKLLLANKNALRLE